MKQHILLFIFIIPSYFINAQTTIVIPPVNDGTVSYYKPLTAAHAHDWVEMLFTNCELGGPFQAFPIGGGIIIGVSFFLDSIKNITTSWYNGKIYLEATTDTVLYPTLSPPNFLGSQQMVFNGNFDYNNFISPPKWITINLTSTIPLVLTGNSNIKMYVELNELASSGGILEDTTAKYFRHHITTSPRYQIWSTDASGNLVDSGQVLNILPDVKLTIFSLDTCAGLSNCSPSIPQIISNPAFPVFGDSVFVSLAPVIISTGWNYQWQDSSAFTNFAWVNLPAPNSVNFTFIDTFSTATYLQCIVTCTATGFTFTAQPRSLNVTTLTSFHSFNNYGLIISPNPTNNICSFTGNKFPNSTLTLYDITSRTLSQQPFNTKATIDLSRLANGVYIAEVKDKEGRSLKGKVVKE